jgi:hypothetical protein
MKLLVVVIFSLLFCSCDLFGPRIVTDVVKKDNGTYLIYSKQYYEGACRVSTRETDKQYSVGDTI